MFVGRVLQSVRLYSYSGLTLDLTGRVILEPIVIDKTFSF